MSDRTAVLIAGPTASGKSAVALEVARLLGGTIVNADSMQVYRELRVLTARPSAREEAQAPHRLYGVISAAERFSAARWLELASDALGAIWSEGGTPVVVGGTGLYFKALQEGLAPVPEIPQAVREHWQDELLARGAPELHEQLRGLDALTAERLKPGDGQRVVRALEVIAATGTPLRVWQETPPRSGILENVSVVRIVLWPDRELLYRRCDARLERMVEDGALQEVATLKDMELDPDLPAMKALGVPQLIATLDGQCSIEDAVLQTQTLTRRYAKRQLTWFRSNMISWNKVFEQQSERMMREVFAILRENELTG